MPTKTQLLSGIDLACKLLLRFANPVLTLSSSAGTGEHRQAGCGDQQSGIKSEPPRMRWSMCRMWLVALTALAVGCERDVEHLATPIIYAHYYGWYDSEKWGEEARTNDPSLGLYESKAQPVVEQHIEWGKRAGITAFSVSWHGEGSVTDNQLKDHLQPAIKSQFPGSGVAQFMILFETPDILKAEHGKAIDFEAEFSPGKSRGDKFLEEMDYIADSYFGSADYYKVEQQPAMFIYLMRDVINHQSYFDTLNSNMEAKGFAPYFIGDVIHWQDPTDGLTTPDSQAADWNFYKVHFKAISGYSLYDPSRYPTDGLDDEFLSDVEAHWETWIKQINANGLRFVPFVMPGYDDRSLRGNDRPILGRDDGQFYRESWAMAKRFMDSDIPHIALTSFNEWHEGTEIEPSRQHGTSYLDDTRELSRRQSAYGTSSDLRQ